jgi:hypothetical protein
MIREPELEPVAQGATAFLAGGPEAFHRAPKLLDLTTKGICSCFPTHNITKLFSTTPFAHFSRSVTIIADSYSLAVGPTESVNGIYFKEEFENV